jgi:hypothetical protein
MAALRRNERTYEISEVQNGWQLKLFEDGEEVGGGAGGEDDYSFLQACADEFCGTLDK